MTDATWLDARQQRTWRSFLQVHGRLAGHLARQLHADSGLSLADYEVLVALTDTPDGLLRPFVLSQQLQWEQSRLSHHLRRMQGRGLVTRQECPSDGRGAFVVLTDEGRSAIEAAAPGHVAAVRDLFFADLDDAQVAALDEAMGAVLRRLDGDVTAQPCREDASPVVPCGGTPADAAQA